MAQDWSGFYGGLSLGADAGDMLYRLDGNPNGGEQIDGTRVGLFAGYTMQNGNFVYGGELNAAIMKSHLPMGKSLHAAQSPKRAETQA